MRDYFRFGDIETAFYGVYVFPGNVDATSARAFEQMSIPGRNGVLLMDEGRYEDTTHEYDVICIGTEQLERLRANLLSMNGYHKLEDSFHKDEFYKAFVVSAPETVINPHRDMSRMRVIFQRRPERWLKAGEQVVHVTDTKVLSNPTRYEAHPLLRFYGDGTAEIGDVTVTTSGVDGYVDLDTETMQAYKGNALQNSKVTVSGLYMPTLKAGETGITTTVVMDITPRWWRL